MVVVGSLEHLVGTQQDGGRGTQPQRSCSPNVDREFEPIWLLDGQLTRMLATQRCARQSQQRACIGRPDWRRMSISPPAATT